MLKIRNIHKSFGSTPVLGGIDLDVNQGDVIAIIGPSGSGKTTLLRCLNYLEQADEGTMVFDQELSLIHIFHCVSPFLFPFPFSLFYKLPIIPVCPA